MYSSIANKDYGIAMPGLSKAGWERCGTNVIYFQNNKT